MCCAMNFWKLPKLFKLRSLFGHFCAMYLNFNHNQTQSSLSPSNFSSIFVAFFCCFHVLNCAHYVAIHPVVPSLVWVPLSYACCCLVGMPYIALRLSTSGSCFGTVATPYCQTNVFLSLLPQFHICTTNKPQARTCFLPTHLPAYHQRAPICPASPPHHASTPGSQHLSIPVSAVGIPSWCGYSLLQHCQ